MALMRTNADPAHELLVPEDWFIELGRLVPAHVPEHAPGFARLDGAYERLRVEPAALDAPIEALHALVRAIQRPHEAKLLPQGDRVKPPWLAEALESRMRSQWPAYELTRTVLAFLELARARGLTVEIDGD